jgi:MFS family permease
MASPYAVSWCGLAALAVAMGIGRFAFTPLLPMMQADAGLTLEQGGWLASANYAGYLAGALWAAMQPVRADIAIRSALLIVGFSTIAMGLTHGIAAWFVLRTGAGIASAWALIHVSSWSLERLAPLRRPIFGSVVYTGVGTGVALAGVLCLVLMNVRASADVAWVVLGITALAGAAAVWRQLDANEPYRNAKHGHLKDRAAVVMVLCYGAYGFGYIVPATFLPVMAREIVHDPAVFGWAWPVFGVAAAASTLAAAPLIARVGNRATWIGCHFVMALGVAAPLLVPGISGVVLSALCVGGTFVVITLVGMQEARARYGVNAARLMAAMTAAFAAGQIAGPVVASLWLRFGGQLDAVLWAASFLLVVSALALIPGRSHERPITAA